MQGRFRVISEGEQDGQTLQGSFRVISEGGPTKQDKKRQSDWQREIEAQQTLNGTMLPPGVTPQQWSQQLAARSAPPKAPIGRGDAAAINAVQGATLQWGDEAAGALTTQFDAIRNAPKIASAAIRNGLPGFLSAVAPSVEAGNQATERLRDKERVADTYHPVTSMAGEVTGGLATAAIPGINTVGMGKVAVAGRPMLSAALDVAKTTGVGGAMGGFFGGAYGAGQANEGDRLEAAKDFGETGAMFGAVVSPGVRYVVAPFLGAVGRKMFSSSEDKAVDIILKRAERAGVSLDDVRTQFERWNKTGDVPETLAELMGPQEKQLLSALITVNRETRETAADVFTKRNRGEAQRLKEGLEGSTGVRGDQFHDEAVRLRQERATAAKPLYDAAHYANDGSLRTLGDGEIGNLYALFRNSETAQRTLERAASEADLLGMPHIRDEIRRFATGLGQGQRPQVMTVQAADYIERNLNDLVRAASKGDSTATNLGTVGALRGFRDQVRSIIDDTGLGAARQRSADAIRAEELLEEGRKALRPGTDIEDVRANLGGDPTRDIPAATDAGRRAYMMGAVRGVSDDLDNQADMGGFANQARALARTPAVRAKIDEIKPKRLTKSGAEDKRFAQTRANAAFDETIDRVANRSQTSVDMVGNSATAFRQGAVDDVMLDFGAGQAAGDAVKDAMTNGPWQALTSRASRAVGAGVDRVFRPGIYNDRINKAAADILLSSGERIPQQINTLAQRAQKRGFNVGGPPPNAPLVATARNAMAKPQNTPPATPPSPPSRKKRIAGTSGDVLALGSVAALGAPPAEGETADYSSQIAATSDRITQLESQIIPGIEADLAILMEGDGSPGSIKKIQQLMNMRLGSNLKVDGALGTETSKAIQEYRADVQAQLQTAQGELEQARQRRSQLEFRQEQQGAPTSNAMLAKAGPLAGFVGGAALAYLNRRRGVRSSRANAANVEKKVNDLISTAPIKNPTRSTNVLAQRAANVNEVWRQGGAGENVPFKQLQSGEWRPRPNAVEPANLYPQKNTLYTTTDLGVAGTGFAEAALIQPLKWETQKKIDQLRSDRERYEAAGDVAGYGRAAKELAAAEDFYSTLVTMERIGIGLGATALGAPLKMRNASPKPNIAGAEMDAALVRGAIDKRKNTGRVSKSTTSKLRSSIATAAQTGINESEKALQEAANRYSNTSAQKQLAEDAFKRGEIDRATLERAQREHVNYQSEYWKLHDAHRAQTGEAFKPKKASKAYSEDGGQITIATGVPKDGMANIKVNQFTDRDAVVFSPEWPFNSEKGPMISKLGGNADDMLPETRADKREIVTAVGNAFEDFIDDYPAKAHVLPLLDGYDTAKVVQRLNAKAGPGKVVVQSIDGGELAVVDIELAKRFNQFDTEAPMARWRIVTSQQR